MNSWYKKNVNENEIICSSSQVIFGINSIAKWANARFVVPLMSRCIFLFVFSRSAKIRKSKSQNRIEFISELLKDTDNSRVHQLQVY